MPLPGVDVTVADGKTGVIVPDTSADSAKVGTSTLGTIGEVYSFEGTDTKKVRDTLGKGPLVDSIVHHLLASRGKRVRAVRGTGSTAGTNSAVVRTGTGPDPGPTVTGAPDDDYQVRIKIITGGTVGTATFQISLDGGDTWGPTLTTAGYAVGNGNTLAWTAGTYIAGDIYTYTCTGPKNTVSDVQAAIDALGASPLSWKFVHLVGFTDTAANCATMATAVHAKMAAMESLHRWRFAIVEAPPVSPSLLASAFASFVGERVMVAGGFCELTNDVSGRTDKRSAGRVIAARIARIPISVAPLRDPNDDDWLAVPNVVSLMPAGESTTNGYLDSLNDSSLDSARFSTLMRSEDENRPGFFIAHGNMMAAVTSDYTLVQHRRVMDRSLEVGHSRALRYTQKRLARDSSTGFILEAQAKAIENDLKEALEAALVDEGHADFALAVTNRSDNLLADPTLRIKQRVGPKGYGDRVQLEAGFAVALQGA
jgi:hypothetical protein